jgi:hypothetical protein
MARSSSNTTPHARGRALLRRRGATLRPRAPAGRSEVVRDGAGAWSPGADVRAWGPGRGVLVWPASGLVLWLLAVVVIAYASGRSIHVQMGGPDQDLCIGVR